MPSSGISRRPRGSETADARRPPPGPEPRRSTDGLRSPGGRLPHGTRCRGRAHRSPLHCGGSVLPISSGAPPGGRTTPVHRELARRRHLGRPAQRVLPHHENGVRHFPEPPVGAGRRRVPRYPPAWAPGPDTVRPTGRSVSRPQRALRRSAGRCGGGPVRRRPVRRRALGAGLGGLRGLGGRGRRRRAGARRVVGRRLGIRSGHRVTRGASALGGSRGRGLDRGRGGAFRGRGLGGRFRGRRGACAHGR
ncbi:hypothetical protein BX257_5620 [Streptomyces sp. 3212.3]|nr:hypothetical protein BX257_5620 [Streptomyces sp. 3212.3]